MKKKVLFSTVREEWWAGQLIGRRDITIFKNGETIRCHVSPFFDDQYVDEITDVQINQYLLGELNHGNRKTGGPLNQNSVRKSMQIIYNVFEYARSKGYVKTNPMELVQKLKAVPSKVWYVYTPEEVDALVEVARPKWMGDAILIAYHNGLRKEEVFGLKWENVDFDRHSLTVKTTIAATSPHTYYIEKPKTPGSEREVLFDLETEKMLKRRMKNRTSEIWVFADEYGKEINPWYSKNYLRKACIDLGMPTHRFHDLRHTHITELVTAGIPLPVIQKRAGHKKIETTMRYTHVTPDMQQAAVDFLNQRGEK